MAGEGAHCFGGGLKPPLPPPAGYGPAYTRRLINDASLSKIERTLSIKRTGGTRCFAVGAVHKVHHAILANFDPLPAVTLCHTSRDPPKIRHTSRTPRFLVGLVQKSRTKVPCTILSQLFAEVFVRGFVRVGFCLFPFCHN